MLNKLQELIAKDESARVIVDIGIGMQWGYQWMLRDIFPNAEIYGAEECKEWYEQVVLHDDKFHKIHDNGEYCYKSIGRNKVDYVIELNTFKDIKDLDNIVSSVSIMLKQNGKFISIEGDGDGKSTFKKLPGFLLQYGFKEIEQKTLPEGFGNKLYGFWGNLEYLTSASKG